MKNVTEITPKDATPVLWSYKNSNWKMAIRIHGKSKTWYIGVHRLTDYIDKKRADYIRAKMENLNTNKKIFKVQGRATVYVYLV